MNPTKPPIPKIAARGSNENENVENNEKTKCKKLNRSDNCQNKTINEEKQQKYSRKSSDYLLNS